MESLILLIIFGFGVAYFATQNTGNVHILLGNLLVTGIPLYVVVIGSILLGIFISWLVHIVNTFFIFSALRRKDMALKKSEEEMKSIEEKNHELEMKIARLTGEKEELPEEITEEDTYTKRPSLFHQFSQNLGISPK